MSLERVSYIDLTILYSRVIKINQDHKLTVNVYLFVVIQLRLSCKTLHVTTS